MNARPALALAALVVGAVGVAAPALASSPRAACPAAAPGTTGTLTGVVVKPETPAARPTASPSSASGTVTTRSDSPTATATATTKPKLVTLEVRVLRGSAAHRSRAGSTYTVVDCSGQGAAARRNDRVSVSAYRVKGDSHRLYARTITVTTATPAPKPTRSSGPSHR